MARFHSLFPSFHPFPRHRPTTLSFHRSDFLLLVSTDVVPIYIRAGRYRKSNFVTSHQPGQDSAPLFRRNYTLAESRSLERFSLIKPTLPPKSAPLLHFCATERRQNSFSDSKTFPPLSLPLSLCVFSAQFRRGNSRNSRVSLELLISYTGWPGKGWRELSFPVCSGLRDLSCLLGLLIGHPLIPELLPIFFPIYMEIFDGCFSDWKLSIRKRMEDWMERWKQRSNP